jgi:DNA-binding transcriptional MerR regulator
VVSADEIAQQVKEQSGDEVSSRMVREYVRLGILPKALHPGRRGFDSAAVGQMLRARKLVHKGLGLSMVRATMQQEGGQHARVQTEGRTGKPIFWISLGERGRVGLEIPKALSKDETAEVVEVVEKALDKWIGKNKVRKTQDV